jgi:hypothetical protein
MEDTEVLPGPTIDKDIEEMLRVSAARATDAYWLERVEERLGVLNEHFQEILDKMALPAEMFYVSLHKIIPKESILQLRVGVDYSTGDSTVLAVISQSVVDKLREIRKMARGLELFLYHERGWDYNFWTITDSNIEQSLVEQDFPICRRESA